LLQLIVANTKYMNRSKVNKLEPIDLFAHFFLD